jgi:hypothetical protein
MRRRLGRGRRNPAPSSQSCRELQQPWDCVRDSLRARKRGGGPGSRGTPAFDPGHLPPGRSAGPSRARRRDRGAEAARQKRPPSPVSAPTPAGFGPVQSDGPCLYSGCNSQAERPPRLLLSSSRKVADCRFPRWHLRHASPTKGPCYRDPSRTFPFGWGFRLCALESGGRLVWPSPANDASRSPPRLARFRGDGPVF